jgi:hypothetical protein
MAKFLWTQRSDFGPGPREGHVMAFDSSRGRTVLFGGLGPGDALLGDTWEWGGRFGPRWPVLVRDRERRPPWFTTAPGKLASFSEAVGSPSPLTPTWGTHGSGMGRIGPSLQTQVRFRAPTMQWRSTATEIGPCYLEARCSAKTVRFWIPGSSTARSGPNRQTLDRMLRVRQCPLTAPAPAYSCLIVRPFRLGRGTARAGFR